MSEIIKNVLFFAITIVSIVLLWIGVGRYYQMRKHKKIDKFLLAAIVLPITGVIGWLLFIIYFSVTTKL